MKLYERLPRTDCRECGEQTCYAFATRLFNDEKQLQDCILLTTTQKAGTRRQIEKMLAPIKRRYASSISALLKIP
jgi:ArsR family metal-binding transcriptional regulator